ncbi:MULTISPECIES: DUF1837 domain-containing protein [unclassified Mesorhizobium]|uniref:HamA C-terminal domain-containing protein n=1 Tax=unclassified Mesorhizobium TaxID=325217 RepID=UPI001128B062|nr:MULTISPECIES: DUF1837 domain-containing protein [unclassified Mesorhizobium]TPM10492.1 DUF1837 domain-containing protein [Mesorhizobium sp. B2-3-8]TPM20491.1 DUF1837 domain-containing protein [Mesorhizobium sp. B2-3-7]
MMNILAKTLYPKVAVRWPSGGMFYVNVYSSKPGRFLERIVFDDIDIPQRSACCAGFELQAWRCKPFVNHLIEWLPDYALAESELHVNHANIYVKLQQAAARVYTSAKYQKRGEAGEIALHAICRDYFDTIPIAPRVFYKNSSNDVVKSFDMVHARFPSTGGVELWLGESKLYTNSMAAIADAIASVRAHLDQGFLTNEKLLLGPQISRSTPHYDEILHIFKSQTSLDQFLRSSVFVIGIASDSDALSTATELDDSYRSAISAELDALASKVSSSSLPATIKVVLIYVPLLSKKRFLDEFDKKLKGLQT